MRHLRLFAGTLLLVACARASGPPGSPRDAPSPSAQGVRFVLEDTYEAGETIAVRIENLGPASYLYNAEYQACDLSYRDASGREFIIPPGTHCDLISPAEIGPGEIVTLFRWDLDECVKDDWGCVKSEPLPAGEYVIAGRFQQGGRVEHGRGYSFEGTGAWDRASARISIIEPSSS